jgi:hypothetical protein
MANTSKRLGNLTDTPVDGGGGGGGGFETGFVKTFIVGDWSLSSGEYTISVPESEHERGIAPSVEAYELSAGDYELVILSIEVTGTGLVKISIPELPDNRFAGKLIIS